MPDRLQRKDMGDEMKNEIMAVLVGLGALGGAAACDDPNDGPLENAAEDLEEAVEELE